MNVESWIMRTMFAQIEHHVKLTQWHSAGMGFFEMCKFWCQSASGMSNVIETNDRQYNFAVLIEVDCFDW